MQPSLKETALLYLKPAWAPDQENFQALWNRFLDGGDGFREAVSFEHHILEDRAIVLFTESLAKALFLAQDLQKDFAEAIGARPVPLYSMIDWISDGNGKLPPIEAQSVPWDNLEPGEVCLSQRAQKAAAGYRELDNICVSPIESTDGFFKLDRNHVLSGQPLLDCVDAFSKGGYPSCFYCGSRQHRVSSCPSKTLVTSPRAIEKLSYLSFTKMNHALREFFEHGGASEEPSGRFQAEAAVPGVLAMHAFYGVKRIFQIPFFRQIWDSKDNHWEKFRWHAQRKEEKGGVLWMGTDCLRVSNLSQAEIVLTQAMEKHGEDYRPYCALGFLHIEKEAFLTARQFFLKALDRTETTAQKIFVNLLMCRLYDIEGYPSEAAEKVNDIFKLDKNCPEAHYQAAILQFKEGNISVGLTSLKKLIARDRQFFMGALLDTDLTPFFADIHHLLAELFEQKRAESREVVHQAKIEYEKAKALFGEKETGEITALWARIQKTMQDDGYFAHIDLIDHGKSLTGSTRGSIQVKKKGLFEQLHKLSKRLERCYRFVKSYRFPSFIRGARERLRSIEKGIAESKSMASSDSPELFAKSFQRPAILIETLVRVESKLKMLDVIQLTSLFLTTFGKAWLLAQSAVAALAIVLFPVAAHYLNLVLPKRGLSPIENVWQYQQGILIVGGLLAVVFACYKAVRAIKKGDRILQDEQGRSDDPCFSI